MLYRRGKKTRGQSEGSDLSYGWETEAFTEGEGKQNKKQKHANKTHTHTRTVGGKLENVVSGIWPKLHLMIGDGYVLGHETTCHNKNLAAVCGNNTIQWGLAFMLLKERRTLTSRIHWYILRFK